MKIKLKEFRFLVYFLPLFFLKLLNITAENQLFVVMAVICFAWATITFVKQKLETKTITVLLLLVILTSVLVITCGKQGAFFSIIMIILLYDIDNLKKIYKISFLVGILGVAFSGYLLLDRGEIGVRYINGEWITMFKRSNILAISCFAVISLWLFLQNEKKIKISQFIILLWLGYGMYRYTGSRSGFLVLLVLLFLIFLFRFTFVQKNKIFRRLCILSPIIGMCISYLTALLYGKNSIVYILDNMLQGRIRLGKMYLDRYRVLLLGQKIYESSDPTNFWNLDCAYLDMLICYGAVFTILWIVSTCLVIKYLYKRERYIEVSVMVAYAVYGISETFLPNCFLNVSLFLYAEWLYYVLNKNSLRRKGFVKYENKNNCNVSSTIS